MADPLEAEEGRDMSVKAFVMIVAVVAALAAAAAVMHHPGARRSLQSLTGGVHGQR